MDSCTVEYCSSGPNELLLYRYCLVPSVYKKMTDQPPVSAIVKAMLAWQHNYRGLREYSPYRFPRNLFAQASIPPWEKLTYMDSS
jgi:hypothetical protein